MAAQEAADQLEAERATAEEAERLENDRLAAEAREHQTRMEAERIAAEEFARLQAERIEAEQGEFARQEAEQLAADEEAARLHAERIAAAMAQPVPSIAPLDRPTVSAMLTEFASDISDDPEPIADEVAVERLPEPAYAGLAPSEQADTAALMRELSSLGTFGMDGPTSPTPGITRPVQTTANGNDGKKKRKGIFGR